MVIPITSEDVNESHAALDQLPEDYRTVIVLRDLEVLGPDTDGMRIVLAGLRAADKVHLGRADKAGHETGRRFAVDLERRADLLSLATTFFDDPGRATEEVEIRGVLRGLIRSY